VQLAANIGEGVYNITNQLGGEVGEAVEMDVGGRHATFHNPSDAGSGVWFGEVLLLFSFTHLGQLQQAAYVSYFQLLPPEENQHEQHLPFACFRGATSQDGGAYGVVLVDSLLWMAPIVPDLRHDGLWRMNNDAWL
jgi:hypothetical protein